MSRKKYNSNHKVVLITGASSGIGRATAELLLQKGHIVYGFARNSEVLQEIKGLRPIPGDMKDEKSLEAAVKKICDEQGRIDVLINNAGYGLLGAVEDVPIEQARRQFEVNVFGLARLTQLVLPSMREAGSGLIINMSSVGGRVYFPLGAWYHASKHAIEGFSDSLRLELQEYNIKLVIVEPGLIATNFYKLAEEPLTRYSSNGAYSGVAKAISHNLSQSYRTMSPPSVVAYTVATVIESKHSRRRYLVGKLARVLFYARHLLGDGVFEQIAKKQTRQSK